MEYSSNDFRLYHHGILGQKWGRKNGPPYPLDESVSTGSRLKSAVKSAAGKIQEHREKRAEIKAANKQRKAEEDAAKKEEAKRKEVDDAVKSGNYEKISQHQAEMSINQFNEAVQRAELNKRLEATKGPSAFDKAVKIAQNVGNLTNSASTIYSNISSIKQKMDAADEAREKKAAEEKAKKVKDKEEKWIRKASPEDFLKNESKMSTAALKERSQRESFKEQIGKHVKPKEEEDRTPPPKPNYVNKEPVNNHKESTWTRDEGNSFWNASYRKLADSDVEVLSSDAADTGRKSFNNALALPSMSKPVLLLEDKSRK